MLTHNVEIPLAKAVAQAAAAEAGVELGAEAMTQLEEMAEQLLWQNRVVLVATIAQAYAEAPAPKKRRGRPKAAAVGADGAPKRRRGRPRKNAVEVPVEVPVEEADKAPEPVAVQ